MSASSSSSPALRVVTYNVLTPHYATPHSLPAHPVVHLDEKQRLAKVLAKLQAEIDKGAVIALQEVSRGWAGHFHELFAKAGYHFVHSGYSRPSSGYMGVGLAWPQSSFEATAIEISRLADTKPWPPSPPPKPLSQLLRPLKRIFRRAGFGGRSKDEDVMASAKDRSNVVIIAQLKSKAGSSNGQKPLDFFIGCYHMPCEFRRPAIMTVHAALLVQRLQALAQGKPHIVTVCDVVCLAGRLGGGVVDAFLYSFAHPRLSPPPPTQGDFNFQPPGAQYQIITQGSLPADNPEYPPLAPGDSWTPTIQQPLRSAHATKWGKEPDFTCYSYADRDSGERFCEPLDYIFVSPEWHVLDAIQLQSKEAALKLPCPFPNEEEPSDHLLLWTELGMA